MSNVVEIATAAQLELEERGRPREHILSGVPTLDTVVGSHGGLALGEVVEVCGAPGAGRTQITLQYAANVQLPKLLGGVCGGCIYIDSRGAFMRERYREVCQGLLSRISALTTAQEITSDVMRDNVIAHNASLSLETFESNLFHYRVTTPIQLIATIASLPTLITSCGAKLIVVNGLEIMEELPIKDSRLSMLCSIAKGLRAAAVAHHCAVLVI
eukprot:PhF_6_TR21920/c1_g1_i1/m.31140/K10870/RAD51L2, RAD51C; RAD51-like protein 2